MILWFSGAFNKKNFIKDNTSAHTLLFKLHMQNGPGAWGHLMTVLQEKKWLIMVIVTLATGVTEVISLQIAQEPVTEENPKI